MKAKNRYERAQQVLNWIDYYWPQGRPVVIKWKKQLSDNAYGETHREGSKLIITLSKTKCATWETTIDTLMHEAAHCILWGMASVEDKTAHHPPSFWALYGEIKDRFDHDHGSEQSKEFSIYGN